MLILILIFFLYTFCFRFLFIIFGWVAVGLLAYQVSLAEPAKAKWDPYEILDISEVSPNKFTC